jgi:hypothetical protein
MSNHGKENLCPWEFAVTQPAAAVIDIRIRVERNFVACIDITRDNAPMRPVTIKLQPCDTHEKAIAAAVRMLAQMVEFQEATS